MLKIKKYIFRALNFKLIVICLIINNQNLFSQNSISKDKLDAKIEEVVGIVLTELAKDSIKAIAISEFTLKQNIEGLNEYIEEKFTNYLISSSKNKIDKVIESRALKDKILNHENFLKIFDPNFDLSEMWSDFQDIDALIVGDISVEYNLLKLNVEIVDLPNYSIISSFNFELLESNNVIELKYKKLNYTDDFPMFPWPPPAASITDNFDIKDFLQAGTYGDMATLLSTSLSNCGYENKSYFKVPNGFAIATQLERFNSNGSSFEESERWKLGYSALMKGSFSISKYLRNLIFAQPGLYRCFVFIVTPSIYVQKDYELSQDEINSWSIKGSNDLPLELKSRKLEEDVRVNVLVYEFKRLETETNANFVRPGILGLKEHLNQSKIWSNLSK